MTIETKNAIITSTMLGVEDHGILTCSITLDYGDSGQSFGGYAFDGYVAASKTRVGVAFGMEFIRRVLDTVGVSRWEDLRGKNIRALSDHNHVKAIGHIIKDKWFDPKADLAFLLTDAP